MYIENEKLIEKINVLGPWVHGYFDLGSGLIIEDQDDLQKKRLFALRKYFMKIIKKKYGGKKLDNKTFCDIGCNTGYFLFELYKEFNFKKAVGFEPRQKNLKKAKFIADFFKLSKKKYHLEKLNILDGKKTLPKFDIVLIPGVLHHLDDHILALKNLFKMTNELCIIETLVISNQFNSNEISDQLELKDNLYKIKENQNKFGIIGYKLETDRLDGATVFNGIVGIPTTDTLLIMLKSVGFQKVEVFRSDEQLIKEVYNKKSYRNYHSVIVVASKNEKFLRKEIVKESLDKIEKDEFHTNIPLNIIEPLFEAIAKNTIKKLSKIPLLIYQSEVKYKYKIGKLSSDKLRKILQNRSYYQIITTFKHAPEDKITYEYAKSLFSIGKIDKTEEIIMELVKKVNLDWRTVYKSYYLLAKVYHKKKNHRLANKFNNLSLTANPEYSLALELKKELKKN